MSHEKSERVQLDRKAGKERLDSPFGEKAWKLGDNWIEIRDRLRGHVTSSLDSQNSDRLRRLVTIGCQTLVETHVMDVDLMDLEARLHLPPHRVRVSHFELSFHDFERRFVPEPTDGQGNRAPELAFHDHIFATFFRYVRQVLLDPDPGLEAGGRGRVSRRSSSGCRGDYVVAGDMGKSCCRKKGKMFMTDHSEGEADTNLK